MGSLYTSGVPYASRVLTIESTDYVADDISLTRPVVGTNVSQPLGNPYGFCGSLGQVEGIATLQMPNATTLPSNGDTFTEDFGQGEETFQLIEVGLPEVKSTDKKVTIKYRKMYNV